MKTINRYLPLCCSVLLSVLQFLPHVLTTGPLSDSAPLLLLLIPAAEKEQSAHVRQFPRLTNDDNDDDEMTIKTIINQSRKMAKICTVTLMPICLNIEKNVQNTSCKS